MALIRDPWAVLETQLRSDSVSKLVPLAGDNGNPIEHARGWWWWCCLRVKIGPIFFYFASVYCYAPAGERLRTSAPAYRQNSTF